MKYLEFKYLDKKFKHYRKSNRKNMGVRSSTLKALPPVNWLNKKKCGGAWMSLFSTTAHLAHFAHMHSCRV